MRDTFLSRRKIRPKDMTLEAIYHRIAGDFGVANLPVSAPPSLKEILAKTLAGAAFTLYGTIEEAYRDRLPSEATGSHLDSWAKVWGLTRHKKTPAHVRLSGNCAKCFIPQGHKFQIGGFEFQNREAKSVEGRFEVDVFFNGEAHIPEGSKATESPTIPGLGALTVKALIDSGTPEESDASLRDRLLRTIRKPAPVGSLADLAMWAKEGGATRVWLGLEATSKGRTVQILLPPGQKNGEEIERHIREQAPLQTRVRVGFARIYPILITLAGTTKPEDRKIVENAITLHFSLRYPNPTTSFNDEGTFTNELTVKLQSLQKSFDLHGVDLLTPQADITIWEPFYLPRPSFQWV